MTTIFPHQRVVTLINTFQVKPENQEALVRLLEDSSETVMKRLRGFVSANIHKSLDGKHVANYAQWRSLEDFEAMKNDPGAKDHMYQVQQLIEGYEPVMYHVEATYDQEATHKLH